MYWSNHIYKISEWFYISLFLNIIEMIFFILIQPLCKVLFKMCIWFHQILNNHSHCFGFIHTDTGPFMKISTASTIKGSKLQYISPLFVKRNLFFDFIYFFLFHVAKVAFISENSKGCHIESGCQRRHSKSLMIWTGRNMGSYSRHWISITVSRLPLGSVNGVRIITCPNLWEIA